MQMAFYVWRNSTRLAAKSGESTKAILTRTHRTLTRTALRVGSRAASFTWERANSSLIVMLRKKFPEVELPLPV
jgi:hypothetical protein